LPTKRRCTCRSTWLALTTKNRRTSAANGHISSNAIISSLSAPSAATSADARFYAVGRRSPSAAARYEASPGDRDVLSNPDGWPAGLSLLNDYTIGTIEFLPIAAFSVHGPVDLQRQPTAYVFDVKGRRGNRS
jgi:hypothetical protein